MDLPCREHQVGRLAQCVDERMDFRGESAARSTDRLVTFFLGAGVVLMGTHNGGVHALPMAEARRQIASRRTGPEPIQNRFNEQPVIRCRAAYVPLSSRQNILDPMPLVVAQAKAPHRSASSRRPPMSQTISVRESLFAPQAPGA